MKASWRGLIILGAFLPAPAVWAADRIIENHSFGVFTDANSKAILFMQNDDCIGKYSVANGEIVIGEGRIDFRNKTPQDIPFGRTELEVTCIGGNKLRVSGDF